MVLVFQMCEQAKMRYERHFSNQHQKLYQIAKAQSNTFSYGHPSVMSCQKVMIIIPTDDV